MANDNPSSDGNSGGITWGPILTTLVLLGIIAALTIPMLPLGPGTRTDVAADQQNLQQLVRAITEARVRGETLPGSTGHRFALALYIGDGGEGRYQLAAGEPGILDADQSGLLLSTVDPVAFDREELAQRIRDARSAGQGVADLGDEIDTRWTSWAGPADPVRSYSGEAAYVFASGARAGSSLYSGPSFDWGGVMAATSTGATKYWTFEELVEAGYDYEPGSRAVHYGRPPFEAVAPYPNAPPRASEPAE